MTPLLTVAVALYSVSAVILGFLAYVYGKTALSTKAKYPMGLFVFAVLLLIQSAGTAAAYVFLGQYLLDEAVPSMSAMAIFELVGVVALLRITL